MNEKILGLDSEKVFYFFEKISQIPRASFHEEAISKYLIEFAKNKGFISTTDKLYNVIIKKPATKGYENAPVVAIQGHMDMVCEKNKNVEHNFFEDPIKILYDGDFIKADRTTLGADNGVAVAMALALLDSEDIPHPAIEAIFTASEETGMEGAMGIDTTSLDCSILLNIDSEDEGVFTVGCAGGSKADIKIPIQFETINNNYNSYLLGIYGLTGGHSGIDVTKGRANSNKLLCRLLSILNKEIDIFITKIEGGSKDNAIPREAEAIISINKEEFTKLQSKIDEINNIYKFEYINTDKKIYIKLEKIDNVTNVFTKKCAENIISGLTILPNGVQTMDTNIDGLPESSINLGVITTENDILNVTVSIRSAIYTKKELIIDQIEHCMKLVGGEVVFRGDYPAWEYKKNSVARDKCIEVYESLYDKKAKIEIIHAGLECGIFSEKMPHVDIVSFGPNMYDIHTPDEKASISSIDRMWTFFKKLLAQIN